MCLMYIRMYELVDRMFQFQGSLSVFDSSSWKMLVFQLVSCWIMQNDVLYVSYLACFHKSDVYVRTQLEETVQPLFARTKTSGILHSTAYALFCCINFHFDFRRKETLTVKNWLDAWKKLKICCDCQRNTGCPNETIKNEQQTKMMRRVTVIEGEVAPL